ncbi:MAG: hypothetical protein KCHDKBKB_00269 [Elusimicrobia bacterium]|nr:hypothetical protein [Elusimicrobiota bacterium]
MSEKIVGDSENIDRAQLQTTMAVLRTIMAADRSLMAWVRTGLSLITFGFTIYKFLQFERETLIASGQAIVGVSSSKTVGLFMIGVGILSLIMGTVENIFTVRSLTGREAISHPRYSLLMAGIILILGLVIFIGILLKLKGIS